MNDLIPWLPRGTVYGTLLNFRREYHLWTPKMNDAPYKAAPVAPVLYIKTANTFSPQGSEVAIPAPIEVGATVGLVMPDAGEQGDLELVLLNDLSLPHASYYRPPIRYRNRDGFLVCGSSTRSLADVGDPAALELEVRVNQVLVQRVAFSDLMRDARRLLADVNAFMTLQPGDVLMLGTDCLADGSRPLAQAGDEVEIRATGFETLTHRVISEDA